MPAQTKKLKIIPPKNPDNAHKNPWKLDEQARRDMAKSFDDTFANKWDNDFWEKMNRKGYDEFDFISIGGKSANSLMPLEIRKLERDVQRDFLKSMLIHNLVNHGDTVEIATISASGAYHFHPVDIDFSGMETAADTKHSSRGGLLARLGLGGKGQPAVRFKDKIPDEAEQRELEEAIKTDTLTNAQVERAKMLRTHRCLDDLSEEISEKEMYREIELRGSYADRRKTPTNTASEQTAERPVERRKEDRRRVTADMLDPKIIYENDISEATRSAKQQPRVMVPKP